MERHVLPILRRSLALELFRRELSKKLFDHLERDCRATLLGHLANDLDGTHVVSDLVVDRDERRVGDRLITHRRAKLVHRVDDAFERAVVIDPRDVEAFLILLDDFFG